MSAGNWYDDRRNLAAVARRMGEQGDSVDDVAYMLERPEKYADEWQKVMLTTRSGIRHHYVSECCEYEPKCIAADDA